MLSPYHMRNFKHLNLSSIHPSNLFSFSQPGQAGIEYLFRIENLVMWARSEMIGSAIGRICSWFQVSGVSKNRILNTDVAATESQHLWEKIHFMSDSDPAVDFGCWHLTPETWHQDTAGKCNHPYQPSGVDQSRALWTRIFTPMPETAGWNGNEGLTQQKIGLRL